ncbi:MAG: mechanosensitive ion channel family protein [Candidatus Bathyarchaeia archaeon]|jgi:small-conductance mechanosensitive channel
MVTKSKAITAIVLIAATFTFFVVNIEYQNVYFQKILYSVIAITLTYIILQIFLDEYATKRIKDSKTRYTSRKVLSIVSLTFGLLSLLIIWITETQNILIAFGLIGAAIAFALQDIFKNFIGGILLFVNGVYRVGDRIEIDGKYGDVIDIGVLNTTLMETREWVSGDQVTGRLTIVPNGLVLAGTIQNYTRDFDFIWDEMTIPITYDSDWNEATQKFLEIIKTQTASVIEGAQKTMERIEGKYYFTKRSLEPSIFLSLTDNWITFNIRYVTDVRSRREIHNRIGRMILGEITKSEKIKVASATLNVTGFPPIQLQDDRQANSR